MYKNRLLRMIDWSTRTPGIVVICLGCTFAIARAESSATWKVWTAKDGLKAADLNGNFDQLRTRDSDLGDRIKVLEIRPSTAPDDISVGNRACVALNELRVTGKHNVLLQATLFKDPTCTARLSVAADSCHSFCAAASLADPSLDSKRLESCCPTMADGAVGTYYTNGLVRILAYPDPSH